MALQGNLEDLPLLDIIQIVSFSKKTGYLSIEMEGGDGAIVFHDGLVVSAFTGDVAARRPAPRRAADGRARAARSRSRIGFALEQLARLREGAFGFELTDDGADDGRRAATSGSRRCARGINPQELLLELAQGIDEDRAHSAAAVEASFAAPEEGVVAEEPIVPAAALAADLRAAADEPRRPPPPRVAATPVARLGPTRVRLPRPSRRRPRPRAAVAAPARARRAAAARRRREAAHASCSSTTRRTCGAILGRHFAAAGFRGRRGGRPGRGGEGRRPAARRRTARSSSSPTSACRPRAGPRSTAASRW